MKKYKFKVKFKYDVVKEVYADNQTQAAILATAQMINEARDTEIIDVTIEEPRHNRWVGQLKLGDIY